MKRFIHTLALSLLGTLAACTGSSEEPTRALLAAAINNPSSNTYQVRFFQSSTLQPDNFDPPRRVGDWDFSEPIVALLYRRSLDPGINDQLWVLTPSHLRRYRTRNLSVDDVGTPQLDGFDQALNVDCGRGYLRQGQSRILLVCPPATPARPIEEYRAWLIPFTANALPAPVNFQDPILARLRPPVRLALGPNDQLLYLTPDLLGQYDPVNPFIERSLPSSLSTFSPTDLIFANGLALGLFDDNDPATTDTTLATWNLSPTGEVGLVRDSNIAARFFARGAPPVFVLGSGLARFEGGLQLPREAETGLSRFLPYSSATVGIDQFLYAAQQDSPFLVVIDLTVNIANNLTRVGVRSSSLGSFQERISGLAFIPVE